MRHGRTDALKRLERLVEQLGHQALRAVFSAAVGRNDRRLRQLLRRCCVVFDRDLEVAEGSCEGCRSQEASWSDLAAVFWARCQLGMPCAGCAWELLGLCAWSLQLPAAAQSIFPSIARGLH